MDTIILSNETQNTQIIHDLGIELQSEESTDIRPMFGDERIIASLDLATQMIASNFTCRVNSVTYTSAQLIAYLSYLSQARHEALPTLSHSLYKTSHFTVTRDSNNQAQSISCFNDENKTMKIREEVIVRDMNRRVLSIVTTQYDLNGNAVQESTMTVNRDANGKMASISTAEI